MYVTDKLEKVLSASNSLKSEVDKLDVGELKPAPTDLKNSTNVVNKQVLKKKDVYYQLVKKVNAADTCGLVKKNKL